MALKKKQSVDDQSKTKSWFQDKYQFVLVQRNILAVITMLSLFASLMAVIAVQRLAPLKTVEPFVIQIDERSGITQVVESDAKDSIKESEAVDNFFLWRYVRARENYDRAGLTYNWETVRVLSDPNIFSNYRNLMSAQNPDGPVARLADIGMRTVSNASITHLQSTTTNHYARVDFTVEETRRGTVTAKFHATAKIEYAYFSSLELTQADRLQNPLGFLVVSYQLEEERTQ
ncbi:MAG: type IV secretion system protein [Rickettsiales bacterium]